MKRRAFLRLAAVGFAGSAVRAAPDAPSVAITMDDFNWRDSSPEASAARHRAILGALRAHDARACLFVIGRFLEEEPGPAMLAEWAAKGHWIANHSYSHRDFSAADADAVSYGEDVLRADRLLRRFETFRPWFRYPMLREGNTAAKREGLRHILREHGYSIGYVTIDTADWYISSRLVERLRASPGADLSPYRDFYLDHLWRCAQFYDDLGLRAIGERVPHTLLVHHNPLNGRFLGDAIAMFRERGWRIVDPAAAFAHPVFSRDPGVVTGQSLIWQIAAASGRFRDTVRTAPVDDEDRVKEEMDRRGL
jgi:peptidoglycan/xylan/chitin deacetylase (PgdA/CDA1 family)